MATRSPDAIRGCAFTPTPIPDCIRATDIRRQRLQMGLRAVIDAPAWAQRRPRTVCHRTTAALGAQNAAGCCLRGARRPSGVHHVRYGTDLAKRVPCAQVDSPARSGDGRSVEPRSCMGLFKLEHSKLVYRADFALYGAAVAMLAAFLLFEGPPGQRVSIAGFTLLGLLSWTGIEYALHRFVLHGLQPFKGWHAQHHQRPTAL